MGSESAGAHCAECVASVCAAVGLPGFGFKPETHRCHERIAKRRRICYPPAVSVRSCRVTIRDLEGIEHSAEVSAQTLYEAVALGLRAIRQCSWVEDIGQNFTIRVLARDTPVEHTVEFLEFHKWLEQRGRSPREVTARARVREILSS